MDAILTDNRDRWNALATAGVMHSVPFLDYTREDAAAYAYRFPAIPAVAGLRVLCLASGGGQDSAAFGLLGAEVTVFDLSDVQLERDREAAAHHGYPVKTVQGDMRDLALFANASFDLVWQSYSINFSPEVGPVVRETARVLRPGGIYRLMFANPFAHAVDNEWIGTGYPLRGVYTDGEEINHYYPAWEIAQPDGGVIHLPRPHEFRHTMSTMFNTLANAGFHVLQLTEWMRDADTPAPGSWEHFTQCMPPYFDSCWQRG